MSDTTPNDNQFATLDEDVLRRAREHQKRHEPEAEPGNTDPKQHPQVRNLASKVDAVRAKKRRAVVRAYVRLPRFSEALGEDFSLLVRRLTPQELLSADYLPPAGVRLLNTILRTASLATQPAREEWGLESGVEDAPDGNRTDPIDALVREYGSLVEYELLIGSQQFMQAVVCEAVIEPELRFCFKREDARNDGPRRIMWVGELEDEDVQAIYAWVMDQEDIAVESVASFPQLSLAPDRTVREDEVGRGAPIRAGSV